MSTKKISLLHHCLAEYSRLKPKKNLSGLTMPWNIIIQCDKQKDITRFVMKGMWKVSLQIIFESSQWDPRAGQQSHRKLFILLPLCLPRICQNS